MFNPELQEMNFPKIVKYLIAEFRAAKPNRYLS